MKPRLSLSCCLLLAVFSPCLGNAAPASSDADAPDIMHKAIQAAACAEAAPDLLSDELKGILPGDAVAGTAAERAIFYVSPAGNDTWSGRHPQPNTKDGPFASIERARDAAREAGGQSMIAMEGG